MSKEFFVKKKQWLYFGTVLDILDIRVVQDAYNCSENYGNFVRQIKTGKKDKQCI